MEAEGVFCAWGGEPCSQEVCCAVAGDDGLVWGDVVAVGMGDEGEFLRGGGIQPEAVFGEEEAPLEMDVDHAGVWRFASIDTIGVGRLQFEVS